MSSFKTKHGDESPYNKKYSMHQHRGSIEDHKRWKREGSNYFAASSFVILGLILSNALDVNPIIKRWPFKPEGWKPIVIRAENKDPENEKNDEENDRALTTPGGPGREEDASSEKSTEDTDTNAGQNQFKATDVLYMDTKMVKPITITVDDLIVANGQLNLFMSATAPLLTPDSISVGAPSREVTAYVVLGRLDDKLGNINSITETYSLIGQSLTLRFKWCDELASEYLRRMKTKLVPLKSKPTLKKHVDAIIPWVFLNNINKTKFPPYDHMAETILLDKDIETKVEAGYNVFEKYLESMEATLNCQHKAIKKRSERRSAKANGASYKGGKSKANTKNRKPTTTATANGARSSGKKSQAPECKNCGNEIELLKAYDQKPHRTRECPFPATKETMQFYEKKALIKPKGKFADRFAYVAAAQQNTYNSQSSEDDTSCDSDQ